MTLQNHHLIPQQLADHSIFNDIPSFNIDSPQFNIIGLPASSAGFIQQHNGSHPGYTEWVRQQLDQINASNLTVCKQTTPGHIHRFAFKLVPTGDTMPRLTK